MDACRHSVNRCSVWDLGLAPDAIAVATRSLLRASNARRAHMPTRIHTNMHTWMQDKTANAEGFMSFVRFLNHSHMLAQVLSPVELIFRVSRRAAGPAERAAVGQEAVG